MVEELRREKGKWEVESEVENGGRMSYLWRKINMTFIRQRRRSNPEHLLLHDPLIMRLRNGLIIDSHRD